MSTEAARDGKPAPRRSAGEPRKRKKGGVRRKLRDMLGLDALQQLGDLDEPSSDDAAPEADTGKAQPFIAERGVDPNDEPVRALSDADLDDSEIEEQADAPADEPAEDETPVADESDDAPVADEPDEAEELDDEPAEVVAADDDEDDDVPDFSADEFLSASPVFKASGRPVKRAGREAQRSGAAPDAEPAGPRTLTSPTAMAIAAVAAEVARLGVPDRHRAEVRGALVALAETLEDGALDWNALRGAVEFSMRYPAIARRVIPLLIPFLDEAA
jgi:hypothetical protein